MPPHVAWTRQEIAAEFGVLIYDHQTAIDNRDDLDSYDELIRKAGGFILDLRGEFGDGRDYDDDPPHAWYVPGIDPKAVGRNVRRGFDWENKFDRGSVEHCAALWHRGVVPEWLATRNPRRFAANAGKRGLQLERQLRQGKIRKADDRIRAVRKLLTDSRDACRLMQRVLLKECDWPDCNEQSEWVGPHKTKHWQEFFGMSQSTFCKYRREKKILSKNEGHDIWISAADVERYRRGASDAESY